MIVIYWLSEPIAVSINLVLQKWTAREVQLLFFYFLKVTVLPVFCSCSSIILILILVAIFILSAPFS